jgi:hypothetical protein
MLRPAAPTDSRAKLREHAAQALELLDGVTVQPDPKARMSSRRQANQVAYALQSVRNGLRRLVGLLELR